MISQKQASEAASPLFNLKDASKLNTNKLKSSLTALKAASIISSLGIKGETIDKSLTLSGVVNDYNQFKNLLNDST